MNIEKCKDCEHYRHTEYYDAEKGEYSAIYCHSRLDEVHIERKFDPWDERIRYSSFSSRYFKLPRECPYMLEFILEAEI